MASPEYALEHFYHGQLIAGGKALGDMQLLACSPGISASQVAEAMQDARILPMPGAPTGSWALVRGRTTPFFLVQAQSSNGGQPMRHVVIPPVDVLRALGGNLTVLRTLVEEQMPIFDQPNIALPFLTLPHLSIPTPEAQTDAMLSLMAATRDRPNVIEALLAALVQEVLIIVKDAPPDLTERVAFVEGLLALLPPPARYGVTFATYTSGAIPLDAQIRFFNEDEPPESALVFNWDRAEVTGNRVKDDYSRFIKSQLWLDTGLVIQRTTALTAVASWRIRRGENLSDALTYASHRLVVDDALANGLPVETPEVARILSEDPTLTDELRAVYVRHLMAFSLALDDAEHADLLATAVRGQPELERVILGQMTDALNNGKADRVYKRLSRWMATPLGFQGMLWIELLHRAALGYAEMLVKASDVDGLGRLLQHVRTLGEELQIDAIIPQLIQLALPLRTQSQSLALTLFALAARSLPPERWQRFLSLKQALPLPKPLLHLLAYFNAEDTDPPPAGLLAKVVSGFTEDWRSLMFIRLCEAALLSGRYRLVDADALEGLADAATSSWGEKYDGTIRSIARSLSVDELLPELGTTGARAILQILLARRAYEDLGNELLRQIRLLYPADRQLEFAAMVLRLFAETPFRLEEVSPALKILSAKGVKPLPLSMAYFGALEQYNWHPTLNGVVAELAALVLSNRMILDNVQPELLLRLLDYYAQVRDTNSIIRLAGTLPIAAAQRGAAGVAPMLRLYESLNWTEDVRAAALNALRSFVRRLDESLARQVIHRLGSELGRDVRKNLEATYLVQKLLGGESIIDYAEAIHTVSHFLYDTGIAYVDKNRLPTISMLVNDLDSLSGGLSREERYAMAEAILELGRLLALMAGRHWAIRPREGDEGVDALLEGKANAQTVIDVFRIIGGYFSQGRRLSARTDRSGENHPLGDRAAHLLLPQLQGMNRLLRTALRALPSNERIAIGADVIQAEIESLWGDVSLAERRRLVRDLAIDLQRIPEMTLLIVSTSDQRALQDDSPLGRKLDMLRQRPESTLEFYRFMHGYFKMQSRADQ